MSAIHRPTVRAAAALVATLATAAAPAAQDTLAELQQRFVREREELQKARGAEFRFEDVRDLATRHARELEAWLQSPRSRKDAINGRLMLTEIQMSSGQEEAARRTLRSIDRDSAPPVELAAAAEMATLLGMAEDRERFITAALAAQAEFEETMALALVLATRLDEPERAEQVFQREREKAADDEARARVGWYRCASIREREDLAEGAFEEALEKLAEAYPDTYWGGVARDRRRAFDLREGSAAIPFQATTLGGEPIRLADLRGKVVLIEFWGSWTAGRGGATELLKELRKAHGESGLVVLGVQLDEERARAVRAVTESGKDWPQIWDGKGFRTDVALRYGIEQAPDYLLIDREGRIVLPPLRVYLRDEIGRRELRDAVRTAVGG